MPSAEYKGKVSSVNSGASETKSKETEEKSVNANSTEKRPSSELHSHSNCQEFSRNFCDPIIRHPVHNNPQTVPILCQNINFHAAPFS
jgi:hypothetical protein